MASPVAAPPPPLHTHTHTHTLWRAHTLWHAHIIQARPPTQHALLHTTPSAPRSKLLSGVTIAEGGVLPNIHSTLLPKKTGKKAEKGGASMSQEY